MQRAEKYGLGIAAAGHILLFGLLSVGFLATPNPLKLESKPIDISLVDAVALEAAAPATTEPPATSEAPDTGPPEDSPPPPEAVSPPEPEPAPAPPVAKPEPTPPPKPAPVAKPQPPKPTPPPKPAPAKPEPAKPAPPKPAPAKPAPAKPTPAKPTPAPAPAKGGGTDPAATRPKPRGSLLGDDFRKSLAISPEKGRGEAPRAAAVSAQAVAGLGDAIARQVQPCANRIPNPGPGANQIRSKLRLQMAPDGALAVRPTLMGQTGVNDENQRYAQRVAELATAAIMQCAPYKLPAELYENGWKDIIINYRLPG
ncbi:cell envelope biogenesis protein TolA [Sphingomonas sp.]|uniref:cell envelope biogenesis protein TolA n=1 Tax=Sphingomonas sp. TaxID=28214 RepID=UPI002B80B3BB|nr:cell envelope biogenesis protein TolA [Sphingomonas sp.]HWK36854.1 cell envelope biogenesis protein TolA [Sphingomonas sp.]